MTLGWVEAGAVTIGRVEVERGALVSCDGGADWVVALGAGGRTAYVPVAQPLSPAHAAADSESAPTARESGPVLT